MPSTVTDRLNGLVTSVAVKAPCRVATTSAITLAGLQVIDSLTLAVNDRVLVKNQPNPVQNGIYSAQTGDWVRVPDFDGSLDAVNGTIVLVTSGLINAASAWRAVCSNSVVIGISAITFIQTFTSTGGGGGNGHGQFLSVKDDFGAVGDGEADDTQAIQDTINFASTTGANVFFPRGIYLTTDSIFPAAGVSLFGEGRAFIEGNPDFLGSWIKYRSPTPEDGALVLYKIQHCTFYNLGIDLGHAEDSVGVFIKSDNNPSTKRHVFREITIARAGSDGGTDGMAVKWGNADAEAPFLEQCDDITWEEFTFWDCNNGFVINATNAADYSKITRGMMEHVHGVCFDLVRPGFMEISYVAAGTYPDAIMFRVQAIGPDPIRIIGCQNEPGGKFMTIDGPNDQGQLILEANVVNQPIEANGLVRVLSHANYINSTITLDGFVRWSSQHDVWDGVFAGHTYDPQMIVSGGAQFEGSALKNAVGYDAQWLPENFKILNGDTAAGALGSIVTRAGIKCFTFAINAPWAVGQTVQPTQANLNDHAYIVTVAGTSAGTEPTWPTGSGATVTSGTVTFKEIGINALLTPFGLYGGGSATVVFPVSTFTLNNNTRRDFGLAYPGAIPGQKFAAAWVGDSQGVDVFCACDSLNVVRVTMDNRTGGNVTFPDGNLSLSFEGA